MFSRALLRFELCGESVEPAYLDGRYAALARSLLTHYAAFEGKPFKDLERSLAELPEAQGHDGRVVRGLRRVIEERLELKSCAPLPPRTIREVVFELRASEPALDPESIWRRAAEKLGCQASLLAEALYADLRREQVLASLADSWGVAELISRYNFRLLQGLLLLAERVRVEIHGQARAVYRLAKLQGLMVEANIAAAAAGGEGLLELVITGPLSLFRRTRKYGQALARTLPACLSGGRFRLTADLLLGKRKAELAVTSADRVLPAQALPRQFDSKVEERFYQDFLRLGCRWRISREASLIPLGKTVFLPDFTFETSALPAFRVDLEIIGFWTRDYLERKRLLLAVLPERRIIFCIDKLLCCDVQTARFPAIPYSRRVPAEKVLEALEELATRRLR